MLNKFGSIRNEVVSILNKLISQYSDRIEFTVENTFKKSGINSSNSLYEKNICVNWYAKAKNSEGAKYSTVYCVGLTMKEFIEEYHAKNIIITLTSDDIVDKYWIYKNVPLFKIYGYVKSFDKENNRINLFLSERIELVSIPISTKTPKWLFSSDRIIGFHSKVYLYWRNLKKELIENADWDPVWKTFKFERELLESELENFPSIFYY